MTRLGAVLTHGAGGRIQAERGPEEADHRGW